MPRQLHIRSVALAVLLHAGLPCLTKAAPALPAASGDLALQHFQNFCFDCHDGDSKKGGLDLERRLAEGDADPSLIFENLITATMPPAKKKKPDAAQKEIMLQWLARRQVPDAPRDYRRVSRHEFVHAVNDLLSTRIDLLHEIPEDRDTHDFDSNRQILLTKELLGSYFTVAHEMLDFALPDKGIPPERIWFTNRIKPVNPGQRGFARPYRDGMLFTWHRIPKGRILHHFFDGFEPPEKGWYTLTFDAAKLGDFAEDISIMVFAGKAYVEPARASEQRMLGVISLGCKEPQPQSMKVFLNPGETVSVTCHSKHTYSLKKDEKGAYIRQLTVKGPVFEKWPPRSYQEIFAGLSLETPERKSQTVDAGTELARAGGRIAEVSSFQKGMGAASLQDASIKTFWHSRFKPTLAKPPHFVVLENPAGKEIDGLRYRAWSGGNGNGQVKAYAVYLLHDGQAWGTPAVAGPLKLRITDPQAIRFPAPSTKRFIKFLVTDSYSLGGESLASIGELDLLLRRAPSVEQAKLRVNVAKSGEQELKAVIKRFAERAFSSSLTDAELDPYYQVSLDPLREHGDFIRAAKTGLMAVITSHRFLLAPGAHENRSYARAATLARIFWLSVPDQKLLELAAADQLSGATLRQEMDRMLADRRISRMIHSFCAQWLNLRAFHHVSPSVKLYPDYTELIDHYLPLETEAYLAHLLEHNLPVTHLIDSDFSILNQRLAQHYGIDGVIGQQLRKVSFGPDSARGGLLTMGSILKVTADGVDTSPILRGAWVSKNIAGTPLSPPPENVTAIEPDLSKARTLREQIAAHKESKSCYGCHKSIDPYGFALEHFDASGQWRTQYRVATGHTGTFKYRLQGHFKLTSKVDASGEINGIEFDDISGLKNILLSDHKKVAYLFAKKFFEYANGHKPDLEQRLKLYWMIPEEASECRLKDLLINVLVYSCK